MSYSRRCAEAPIGKIKEKAELHPYWKVDVLDSGELCLQYKNEPGHYIFGFINVCETPNQITTKVACYACPSAEADEALLKLIRSAKV